MLSSLSCLYQISMFLRWAYACLLVCWAIFSIFLLLLRIYNLVIFCLLFNYKITEINEIILLVFLNRSCIYCLSIVLINYILNKSLLLFIKIIIDEFLSKLLIVWISINIYLLNNYSFILNIVPQNFFNFINLVFMNQLINFEFFL